MPKGIYERPCFEDRFWSFVAKAGQTECWLWTGALDRDGYGRIRPGVQRTNVRAHRASWMLHFGEIPQNMIVCHKCDNPTCVNPNHLFLGTTLDNAKDMIQKGRKKVHKGQSHYKAKFTDKQVENIRELYSSGAFYQKDLATMFRVGQSTISAVIRGERYHN